MPQPVSIGKKLARSSTMILASVKLGVKLWKNVSDWRRESSHNTADQRKITSIRERIASMVVLLAKRSAFGILKQENTVRLIYTTLLLVYVYVMLLKTVI